MEDMNSIAALLEKYYNGETSTAEESLLREFFAAGDLPEQLAADAELFGFFRIQQEGRLPGDLQNRLEGMIDEKTARSFSAFSKWKYYWISGAAAAILILLALFMDLQISKRPSLKATGDTYEDPYLAYAEAKRVLYLVSDKMNTGRKPLQNLEKIESGKQFVQPVFSIGTGLQKLEYFSTIEKTKELISKQ
jgi:hypothetical protein